MHTGLSEFTEFSTWHELDVLLGAQLLGRSKPRELRLQDDQSLESSDYRGSRYHIIQEVGLKDHIYDGFGDLILQ